VEYIPGGFKRASKALKFIPFNAVSLKHYGLGSFFVCLIFSI
jgi:hypothetical protein